jgi:hypothetical protein
MQEIARSLIVIVRSLSSILKVNESKAQDLLSGHIRLTMKFVASKKVDKHTQRMIKSIPLI